MLPSKIVWKGECVMKRRPATARARLYAELHAIEPDRVVAAAHVLMAGTGTSKAFLAKLGLLDP
jgi:hypothetical protein